MPDIIPFNAENNLTVTGSTAVIEIDSRIDSSPLMSEWAGFVTLKAFRQIVRAAGDGIERWELRILSPGGNAVVGNAIAQEIKRLGKDAETVAVVDAAGSAATIVALACQRVVIAQNGQWFIHQARGSVWDANGEKLQSYGQMVLDADTEMVRVYADKTGETEQQIRNWMKVETWFTAARALEVGFADELTDAVDGLEAFSPDGLEDFDSVLHAFSELRAQFRGKRSATPPADTPATDTEEPEMEAATLKELKAALPKADSDFLVEQLEADATVADATVAWADHLQAKLEAAETARTAAETAQAQAEQKAAEAAATPPKPGSKGVAEAGDDPHADGDDDGAGGKKFDNAEAEWKRQLKKKHDAGETRADAVFELMNEQPELYEAYLRQRESRIDRRGRRPQASAS